MVGTKFPEDGDDEDDAGDDESRSTKVARSTKVVFDWDMTSAAPGAVRTPKGEALAVEALSLRASASATSSTNGDDDSFIMFALPHPP